MAEHAPDVTEPVSSSRWRLAVLVSVVFGGGLYLMSQWVAGGNGIWLPPRFDMKSVVSAPLLAVFGFGLWWLLRGDGRWYYRMLSVLVSILACAAVVAIAQPSLRPNAGMWGIPLAMGFAGLVLAVTPSPRWRRIVGPAAWLLAIAPWLQFRNDVANDKLVQGALYSRNLSTEELVAEQLSERATVLPAAAIAATEGESVSNADWPGFRGPFRTGEVPSAAMRGWNYSPPQELWRHELGKVGPAWSSFCIVGNKFYTQEQRGKAESVVCYRVATGEEMWSRGEPSSHYDAVSGTGPRATPSYANGFVYAVSTNSIVSCLRATTGEPVWVVNLTERFEATKPIFGLTASPLMVGGLTIINPASAASPRLVALEASTGKTRWATEARGTDGYSSPHPAKIQGVDQVLLFNESGLFSHDPDSGRELWHYDWTATPNEPATVQPLVLADGRIVIGGGVTGLGIRCVAVRKDGSGWSASEAWRTTRFTPRFNDVVCSGDYLYGLDGGALSCLKLADGRQVWKDGYYGAGQLLLVGDKLLIVSETGQLACVAAKPDDYEELWKRDAIKGKTWNHPAIAHGRLFVRNMSEMAVFDLPNTAEDSKSATSTQK